MEPRNRFQGINSANLCSLAGRYDNPIPPRFLAPIDSLKIPALCYTVYCVTWVGQWLESNSMPLTLHNCLPGSENVKTTSVLSKNSDLTPSCARDRKKQSRKLFSIQAQKGFNSRFKVKKRLQNTVKIANLFTVQHLPGFCQACHHFFKLQMCYFEPELCVRSICCPVQGLRETDALQIREHLRQIYIFRRCGVGLPSWTTACGLHVSSCIHLPQDRYQ